MDHRTKVEFKFEPEGDEKPGPIGSFQLVRTEDHETRRSERERWHTDVSRYKREVVADGITRRQMAALITDAADWLSYIEPGDACTD
jgi:hypothetical protein